MSLVAAGQLNTDPIRHSPNPDRRVRKIKMKIKKGDKVRIKSGVFVNHEGVVDHIYESTNKIAVTLIINGIPTPVEVEKSELEKA